MPQVPVREAFIHETGLQPFERGLRQLLPVAMAKVLDDLDAEARALSAAGGQPGEDASLMSRYDAITFSSEYKILYERMQSYARYECAHQKYDAPMQLRLSRAG